MSEALEQTKRKVHDSLGKYEEITDFKITKNHIVEGLKSARKIVATRTGISAPRQERILDTVELQAIGSLRRIEKSAKDAFHNSRIAYDKFREKVNPALTAELLRGIDAGREVMTAAEKIDRSKNSMSKR